MTTIYRWLAGLGLVVVLWLSSLAWVHHSAIQSERARQAVQQAKTVAKHTKARQHVDDTVNALPDAPTAPIGDPPAGSAAERLRNDWQRD